MSVAVEGQVETSASIPPGAPATDVTPERQHKMHVTSQQLALILKATRAFAQRPPVQGALLRNGAVITLVSFFEGLVSEILHVFYREHPDALPAESRSLSLADLRALGSISSAEQFLTSKEVDSILRESLDEQLGHFSKRLQIDLAPLNGLRGEITEVFQPANQHGVVTRVGPRQHLHMVDRQWSAFGSETGNEMPSDSTHFEPLHQPIP